MTERCENCKFFGDDGSTPNQGRCKRYPPTALILMTPNGPGEAGIYPPTGYNNVCGEWVKGNLVKVAHKLPSEGVPPNFDLVN